MQFLNLAPTDPETETDVEVVTTTDEEVMLDPPFKFWVCVKHG